MMLVKVYRNHPLTIGHGEKHLAEEISAAFLSRAHIVGFQIIRVRT